MDQGVSMDAVYAPSPDVVAREIEGHLLLVPVAAGIADLQDELFTFNETGKAMWDLLDGRRTLAEVARELASEYDAEPSDIEAHTQGLVTELLRRRMVVAV